MKKIDILPKNREHFKRLIPFAKKIIEICRENNIEPLLYGSFSHFYHTKDKTMNVNDIDLIIPKKDFSKIVKELKKKTNAKIIPENGTIAKSGTIIIKKGKLKVELDEPGIISEEDLEKRRFEKIDFYGIDVKIICLNDLENIYPIAYHDSIFSRDKTLNQIKSLEKFLGRKLKQDVSLEIVKNKDLSKKQKEVINHARVSHWGEVQKRNFSKDYEPDTLWFFIKNKKKVVSLGGIRPIKAEYLGKKYDIGGICSTISLVKKKGYGRYMVHALIDYSIKTGKSIVGFTAKENLKIFSKTGLQIKEDFIRRFIQIKPNGEKFYDNDGHGIFYNGKDDFISKVLKTKSPVYVFVEHW